MGGRACPDCPELGLPPPLAPAAPQAERSRPTRARRVASERLPLRRGAGVQDARALHPGAHRAQAGGQQRLLLQVQPPAGHRVLRGEHKGARSVGAPAAGNAVPPRLRAPGLSPTRRQRAPPGAQRSAGSPRLSARSPLGRSLGESGSASAGAVPSPPGARGGEMEGFPRGLSAGGRTASGAGSAGAEPAPGRRGGAPEAHSGGCPGPRSSEGGRPERPGSCLRRGGGAGLPALSPSAPPPPPARPRRRRGALITIREAEAAGAELGGGGGSGGRSSSSRASRGKAGAAPGQQTPPPPEPRVPRRPGPAAAPGGSTWSSSSSNPADSPRGPVPAPPRRGRRRPPLPGAWPRARAIPPPPPPLPGERESKGGSAGGRRDGGSGRAQGTGGRGRRGRGGAAGRGAAGDVTSSGEERLGPGRRGGADPGESVAGAGGCGLAEAAGEEQEGPAGPGRPGQGAARLGNRAKAGGARHAALRNLRRLRVAAGRSSGFWPHPPLRVPAVLPTLTPCSCACCSF